MRCCDLSASLPSRDTIWFKRQSDLLWNSFAFGDAYLIPLYISWYYGSCRKAYLPATLSLRGDLHAWLSVGASQVRGNILTRRGNRCCTGSLRCRTLLKSWLPGRRSIRRFVL